MSILNPDRSKISDDPPFCILFVPHKYNHSNKKNKENLRIIIKKITFVVL